MSKKHPSEIDYTKEAADHLREKLEQKGLSVGSSHSHALVASVLGYNSRAALLAENSNHSTDSQWLSRERPDNKNVEIAIQRMKKTVLKNEHVPLIIQYVRDGLTPECCETGQKSFYNLPVGNVEEGDETDWVHPSVVDRNGSEFGYCRCCGEDRAFRVDELDHQGLCEEHEGEFDLDEDEEQDWADYIEYHTKDGY